MTYATNVDSDQPAHPQSLIRAEQKKLLNLARFKDKVLLCKANTNFSMYPTWHSA